MSNHHSSCSSRTGGAHRRCDCTEDLTENDKLWNDFEGCAQAVARLYSDSSWRNFRGAAEGTTQLYKTSTDSYRRGFEKGFSSGCTSIAKEILQAFRDPSKIDMNIVLEVLYRNMAIPREERLTVNTQNGISSDTLAAVELFQQALNQPQVPPLSTLSLLPPTTREQTTDTLDEFLASQVQRHRKRQRSPNNSTTSPTSQMKRQRRL
ncbi:Essential protein Yae1 N-terminal domain-containing protein [Caenorhabditis elegans]|uniref:Essential protein Yae1 N-terminal domain-containing protein n=1 Tax=Caenorhabditis elegans TaxID=6239 RepID=O01512_CAEEL|nr:Essential protein Yae1 N-terminal domain-containing protein [Caenorhabditis elegans]CCD67580.1 Essential protein Yae1 N-terminal domain-containing protein [Caenorhabditis elegans]|eukprot:NP_491971.1 Uncharacterized protein CELE_C48B6.3 [Caenorhabditis elegans]